MEAKRQVACLIFLAIPWVPTDALSCGSTMGYLTARSTAQTLLSPGYPENYENNEECGWLISTSDSSKRIQVEIVSLQLGNWDGEECEDYLQLADGKEPASARVLGTWCEAVQVQVKSSGQHLLVTFVSDAHVTGPGFALKYYHIDDYKTQCDPFGVRTLSIGDNPLFVDLPMYTSRLESAVVCDYHLKSDTDDDVTIDLELLTYSKILCQEGTLIIYDGASPDSPVLLNWCYESQPFSKLSGSSKDLFIRFSIKESLSDWLVFRAKVTRSPKTAACSLKSMPNLELSSTAPTYIAFPVLHSSRQVSCPLRLWTEKQGQAIRLEVKSKDLDCGPRGVNVYDGYDPKSPDLRSFCDSQIIRGTSHNMVLAPVDGTRTAQVYLKLSVLNSTCNGVVQRKRATHDEVRKLPELANSELGHVHDLNCTYLLESDHTSDVIEVSLKGRLVAWDEYDCQGDVVTFYDGNTTLSPILTTWCGSRGQASRVVSTGPRMLVILTTDGHHSHEGVRVAYYSLPKNGGCPRQTGFRVNSTEQTLTSPNYPMYYPMNSYCIYKLTAPEQQYIVLEVTYSSMESDCSDHVKVYNGHKQTQENYLGRWCGGEKPKYQSKGNKLLVVFSADNEYNSGGFEAKFYATVDENPLLFPIIVGVLAFAIIAAIIGVVIYMCVQRRKKLQRS